jgi:hypothetical protein
MIPKRNRADPKVDMISKVKFMIIYLMKSGNTQKLNYFVHEHMEELKHENRRLQCEMDWNEDRVCALEGERKEIVERLKVK